MTPKIRALDNAINFFGLIYGAGATLFFLLIIGIVAYKCNDVIACIVAVVMAGIQIKNWKEYDPRARR